ncbi:pilus assembly protein TadC [Vibrio harveyi]|uniref:type II secretion system F family protein n=1 Tax=Vibrio harveyi TaxID=669 RepID=UPI0005395D10|nr:type II secretion system F family protein [Vibrio harveyi]AIV06539.1 pilus assembly protein TadC [Vibrio harveyi]
MEYLNLTYWQNMILNFDTNAQYMFYGLVLLTTMAFTFTVGFIVFGLRSPLDKRVRDINTSGNTGKDTTAAKFAHTLDSLSPYIAQGSEKEKETYIQKLMHAGFHNKSALSVFYALKGLSALLGLIIAFGIYYLDIGGSFQNLFIITAVFIGVFLPNILLEHMKKERQRKIRNGVPDALDLLVVCTESGLGFNAALNRVTRELYVSHPEFADELDTVCTKIQAGVTMPDALAQLVSRTGLVELSGLVSVLTHAAKIGGSLGETLRSYTDDFRDKRQQAAEEIAAKIPTKMLFPMLLFIWPCFFIVALGPGILIVLDALSAPGASL